MICINDTIHNSFLRRNKKMVEMCEVKMCRVKTTTAAHKKRLQKEGANPINGTRPHTPHAPLQIKPR